METPYQLHSRVFQLFEKKKLLKVISTDYNRNSYIRIYNRKNNAFPPDVGTYKDDPDWDNRLKIKYCNNWLLKFERKTKNR